MRQPPGFCRPTRRQFVVGAGAAGVSALLAGCRVGAPQPPRPPRMARIGFLSPESSTGPANTMNADSAFREGLRELGYVEGQNIAIEWRYLEGRLERAGDAIADLIRIPVDVLAIRGETLIREAKGATSTIPIVMTVSQDPVRSGLIQSLARPGGNVTGVSSLQTGLAGKRLHLLKEAVPSAARVGMFWQPDDLSSVATWEDTSVAAQTLGVQLQSLAIQSVGEFEHVAHAIASDRPDALILTGGVVVTGALGSRIAGFAREHALPTMFPTSGPVRAGGLMSYGANVNALHRRAAYYVDRILRGTKPADLPVEQPMLFEFVVNRTTAKALGIITWPESTVLQVTEVVD